MTDDATLLHSGRFEGSILEYKIIKPDLWKCEGCKKLLTSGQFASPTFHGCVPLHALQPIEYEPEKKDLKPPAPDHKSKKPPMHALPLDRLGGLARALDYGDAKYAPRNWVDTAKEPKLYIGAALRHLAAIQRGEMIDPESGLPHVNHFQACAVILEEALRNSGELVAQFTD